MEDLKAKAENLSDSISSYVETSFKLLLLNTADKATGVAASAMAAVVIVFLGIFVLLFGGIALGIWLGHLLENEALGYLLVAGLFILVILILVAMRKKIVFPLIRNKLIKKLYEQNDNHVQ